MKKESTWYECVESSSSVSITPDKGKAKSLLDTAEGRIKFLDALPVTPDNANYLFEGYYSSALELLHALLLLQGYKVENHICLGYYLRDVLQKPDLFRLFDDCRFKRNSFIYYGRKMEFAIAKFALETCQRLIHELERIIR